MADKKLNISADLKVKTTDAERMLQKLTKEGIKISNILKGLDLNTNQGRAGFAKSLITANKEMLKLRGTTQDTAKVMEHVYGRQLERHTKNIDKYTKKIDELNRRFKTQQYNASFQREIGNEAGAAKFSGMADRTAARVLVAEAAKAATQAAMRDLQGGGGGAGPTPVNFDKIRTSMAITQAVTSSIGQIMGTLQSTKTMDAQNLAGTRDFERNLLSRMSGGDFSDLYFANRKMRSGKTALEFGREQAGGQKLGFGQLSMQAMGGAGQAIQGGLSLAGPSPAGGMGGVGSGSVMTRGDYSGAASGIGGGVNTIVNAGYSASHGGPAAMEAATVAQQLEFQKLQDPMAMAALGFLQSTAGMRVSASKGLQGRHMGAWGIGMGQGLDMGESFAVAQGLSRQFGVNATMGSSSTRIGGVGYGGMSEREAQLTQMAGMEAMIASGQKVGSVQEYRKMRGLDPATGQQLGSITTRNGGLMSGVLGLERMGMDRGVAGGSLGTMLMATGGNMNKASKELEDVMTKAFGRGITDARLGEEIVKATGEMAFGYGGANQNMAAVGMMLSGGLSGNSTLRETQANVSGFQAVNSLLSGNDFFRAVGAESAHRILGAGGTGSQMMAASKSSLSDLVGGSEMLTTAGISPQQRRAMLNDRVNSLMGAYLTNTNDPQTAQLRQAISANGGDVVSAMQGAGGKLNNQFALALSTSSSIGFEQAQGFARDLQGFGSTADKGANRRNFASHGDGTAEATVRTQQAVLNELFKKEQSIREEYLAALKNQTAQELTQSMDRPTDPDFKSFNQFMDEFTKLMREAYDRSRQAGPKNFTRAH